MSPTIASAVFAIGIGALFLLDRNGRAKTSIGLWIPVIWVLIAGSRSVAEWMSTLGGTGITDITSNADAYLEGNPTDRLALTVLLAAGLIVLVARRRQVGELLLANAPIAIFFLYCALSTLWSDYSDVSFKRWVKALGDLVMVLIVLTDPDRVTAVKRLLARTVFLLVPTSVLLIKYYPDLGRGYHPWTWTPYYTGVTLNKNELGYVCLIFGLGSVWRCLQALGGKGSKIWIEFPARAVAIPRSLIAHLAVLAMVMWLFWMANSMTSFSCFLMASVIMATTTLRAAVRKPWLVHVLVAAMLAVSFSALFLDLGSGLVQTMGRDPTLTGRTEIWSLVLGMVRSPLLGTGFESFWLGKRLEKIWSLYWWHPREAHDGYIEVFLNLGWVGIILLAVVLLTGYRNVIAGFHRDMDTGRLRLAYFIVGVAYNFTESAIKMTHPVWIFFLLATTAVPGGWLRTKTQKAVALPAFSSEAVPCLEEV